MRVLVALVLVSCSAAEPDSRCTTWNVAELTADQAAVVADAAVAWSSFGARAVSTSTTDGCAVRASAPTWGDREAGFFAPGSRTMHVRPDAFRRELVMHEMGHALGLEHVADGVMAATPGETFTADDRRECVRAGACR